MDLETAQAVVAQAEADAVAAENKHTEYVFAKLAEQGWDAVKTPAGHYEAKKRLGDHSNLQIGTSADDLAKSCAEYDAFRASRGL